MPLMNTMPASISSMKRCCSAGSLVQALAPRPNSVSLARRMASSMPVGAQQHGHRSEQSPRDRPANPAAHRPARWARRSCRAGRSVLPPVEHARAHLDRPPHLAVEVLAESRAWPAGRPAWLRPSDRPRAAPCMPATKRRSNSAAMRCVHDEAFGGDAGLAVIDDARLHRDLRTARARSARASPRTDRCRPVPARSS